MADYPHFRKLSDTPKAAVNRFFPSLWGYLSKQKWALVFTSCVLVIAAGLILALGQGIQYLINEAFGPGEETVLNNALPVFFAGVIVLGAISYLRVRMVTIIGERFISDLRKDVFERLITLDQSFYLKTNRGELISRLTADTTLLQQIVSSSLPLFLRNGIMLIGALIFLFLSSAKLTLMFLTVIPLILLPLVILGRRSKALAKDAQDRVGDLGGFLDEHLHAIETVQSFTLEERAQSFFGQRVDSAFGAAKRQVSVRAVLSAVILTVVFSAVGMILWVGGQDVVNGRMSPGALGSFVFYALLVAGASGVLSEVVGNILRAAGAMERILGLLSETPRISVKDTDYKTELKEYVRGRIAFDAVSFAYESAPQTQVLKDISFEVKAGETIAIVGRSGAGKTTIFRLLQRFYDPQKGAIYFDRQDMADINPKALRRYISIVPQEPFIFSASVRDNIALGVEDACQEEIELAARKANAHDFIMSLPEGYQTQVGERGAKLSTGQKQRLAIARALLKNPPVILLDEPTSALDAHNEVLLQKSLSEITKAHTTLIIAHRLSTIAQADRILVVEDGRIIEQGTHEALLAKGGAYKALVDTQLVSEGPASAATKPAGNATIH